MNEFDYTLLDDIIHSRSLFFYVKKLMQQMGTLVQHLKKLEDSDYIAEVKVLSKGNLYQDICLLKKVEDLLRLMLNILKG